MSLSLSYWYPGSGVVLDGMILDLCTLTYFYNVTSVIYVVIAPDKDSRQLGIYPPIFGLIGYFKF